MPHPSRPSRTARTIVSWSIASALCLVLGSHVWPGAATAQTAREVRGPSPYETLVDEPAPKLVVDAPLPGPLTRGVLQVQYRVENLRLLPVFGPGALDVSPRVGHLHISLDDLPWWWADASDDNTIDVANLPPGPHRLIVRLVDPSHRVFAGQVAVIDFVIPDQSARSP